MQLRSPDDLPFYCTKDDIQFYMTDLVDSSSLRTVGKVFGVSHQLIDDIIKDVCGPGKTILDRLGLEKVTIYVKKGTNPIKP